MEEKIHKFVQPASGIHVVPDNETNDWDAMKKRVEATNAKMAKKPPVDYKGEPKTSE